jgi:hypothetical protein
VDHPAARQRCRFSVLALLAPRQAPRYAYRRAAYDRDGGVLVKGVLTGRKLRRAQRIVGPPSGGTVPFQVGETSGALAPSTPGARLAVTVGHGQSQYTLLAKRFAVVNSK